MPLALTQFPYALVLALLPGPGAAVGPATLPAGDDPAFRPRVAAQPDRGAVARAVPIPPADRAAVLPRLSSRFGYRRDPVRGGHAMHAGIDIPGPAGSQVRAAEAGRVRFAAYAGGYGNVVEIVHAGGLTTRYAHLSQMLVRAGTLVERGAVIALMGSTGRSTGSHLHFEVRLNGQPMDPLRVLGPSQPPGVAMPTPLPQQPHISAFARARAGRADPIPGGGLARPGIGH